MKNTEPGSSAVRNAATSPLRSRAGPAVWTSGASSSRAAMCASEVLPRPGGPASSTWSSASPRRRAASMNSASWRLTCSWPTKSSSACGRRERSSSSSSGRAAGTCMLISPGRRAHAALTAVRSAAAIRSSGAASSSALGDRLVEHRLRLRGVVAEADEALARQRPRTCLGRRPRRLGRELAGDALAQLDDHALGRLAPDAGHDLEALHVARRDREPRVGDGRAGQHRERHLRPDSGDGDQPQEELTLLGGGEAVELHRVVAQDQVCEHRGRLALRGQLAERLGGGGHAVAHPTALDHGMVGPTLQNLAVQRSDHVFGFCAAARTPLCRLRDCRPPTALGTRGRSRARARPRRGPTSAARAARAARRPCAGPGPCRPRRCPHTASFTAWGV